MTAEDAYAIQSVGLAKRYGPSSPWVLRDVNLRLPIGSRTAVVGPNGAGKSTLLRCIVGFERPTAGRVLALGADPRVDRAKALAEVAYVPQGTPLYHELSVRDHIDLVAAIRRTFSRRLAVDRIQHLAIPLASLVGRLSGGQRAQVALALALSSGASILLLDEPTASLDPLARREFFTYASAIAGESGLTMLVATHIVSDCVGVCDRIVVLAPQRVALDAPTAEATSTHSVLDAATDRDEVVGAVPRPRGASGVLVRVPSGGNASLEDVVLGYLDATRTPAAAR